MSIRSSFAMISMAAIVAAGTPTMALAGSCTKTKRSWGLGTSRPSADTIVKNKTNSKTINVYIYRGDTLKQQKWIGPGEKVSYRATMSKSDGEAPMRVQLYSGNVTTACAYAVRNNKGDWMEWNVARGYESVCPNQILRNVTISCDKSYNIDKRQFDTVFELKDDTVSQETGQ